MLKKASIGKNIAYQGRLDFQNVRTYFSHIIYINDDEILVDLV